AKSIVRGASPRQLFHLRFRDRHAAAKPGHPIDQEIFGRTGPCPRRSEQDDLATLSDCSLAPPAYGLPDLLNQINDERLKKIIRLLNQSSRWLAQTQRRVQDRGPLSSESTL